MKLVWTREEEIRQGRYRPQAAVRFKAGFAADGMPMAFDCAIRPAGSNRATGINKVENGLDPQTVEGFDQHVRTRSQTAASARSSRTPTCPSMPWRSPGSSQNVFFVESSSTRWRKRQARTLTSCAARCWQASPTSSACSTPWRRRAIGVSRSVKAAAAASLSTKATDRSSARSPRSR